GPGGKLSRMCSSHRALNVAVVGATGMVGQEMLRVLGQRKFPVGKLKAMASERSEGGEVRRNGHTVPVEALREDSFEGVHPDRSEPGMPIAATCVRVPVKVCHGESVFLETERMLTADDARLILGMAPGVIVEDDPHARLYPTPAGVAGKDEVYVGRIRNDLSASRGLALWIVSDNLRKGAALNAVQIAERVMEMGVL